MRARAVFLDRDGVLNEATIRDCKPYPPANIQELVIVADADISLARLKEEGFLLIVVTNQPDVSRGKTNRAEVEAIHRVLSERLPLDDFFVCYHDDQEHCSCRKPSPGLLLAAAAKYDIDLSSSYLVGDRWRDIDAGAAAGCKTILIDRCYKERLSKSAPHMRAASLSESVDWILTRPLAAEL